MAVMIEELQQSLDAWAKDIQRENVLLKLELQEQKLEISKIKEAIISINQYENRLHGYITTKLK